MFRIIPTRFPVLMLCVIGSAACIDPDGANGPDASIGDATTPDIPDAGREPGYSHVPPPDAPVAEILKADTWLTHHRNDILPYWTMSEAMGVPEGNFPTNRGMTGSLALPSERRPRMIGRQTYAYAVGYMLTGDERLLQLSRAGVDWLLSHAKDRARGGWHGRLDENGMSIADDPSTLR